MNNFEIVIESSADLNKELRAKYGIHDEYLRGVIYMPNKEVAASLDWENQTSKEFYSVVKAKPGNVHTAFATAEEFERVLKPILDEGKDALVFAMTSGMSGTYNSLKVNAEMMLERYPDRKIIVIDSLKYSAGTGLLAITASEYRSQGMSLEETAAKIEEVKYNLHEIGPMDDLRFLVANGRVQISNTKAFFGQLAGVQPVADFTIDGKNQPFGTITGVKKVDAFVQLFIEKVGVDLSNQIIFIAHSQRADRARRYKDMIAKTFNPKEIHVVEVTESCGANIGPGLCAVFFYGTPITADRAVEQKLFEDYKNAK